MKFIIGTKQKMTQIFNEKGDVTPVTPISIFDCVVSQVKTSDTKDGYNAVQISYLKAKEKKVKKAQKGHLKDLGLFRYACEFKTKDKTKLNKGDHILIDTFQEGDKIKISGTTKGKGFQGVVRRHGFKGSLASHGHKDQLRMPGSIGATAPARVFKGTKMGGRMGGKAKTVANLQIVKIDNVQNIIYVKGAVPGAINSVVQLIG